ncbi:MAG: hypothetical protein KIT33_12905 [Candidatus Kapabacteria bacterium]|nr:hypothetical protein [Ignavibacteriota bacterium]MCW5885861.1 hypothetical protein [Candidatus Kapabacteria bacterium]
MYKYLIFLLLICLTSKIYSQNEWGGTPYGYVKADVFLDTRQVVNVRDGHVLLYPAPRLEANGEDANEGLNFNILAIQSRFGFRIKAPDFLGAKASGVIEGEFFGSTNTDIGSVRLRLANVKLDWGKHEVVAGHDWHPLFIAEALAQTISFNTGIPFVAFARNPLVTYTYKTDNFKAMLSGVTEMEFPSTGPQGPSTSYLRNAGFPMLNLGLRYSIDKFYFAANANYKELKPRLISDQGFKDHNVTSGFTANFLMRYKTDDFYITASVLQGQNTFDLLMLGGYAVKSIDPTTGVWEYSAMNTRSAWLDMQYGKDLTFGVFGGFETNLGANDEIVGNYYARGITQNKDAGTDIDYIYRLSPRIAYKLGKTQIATELEYSAAAYGKRDNKGKVSDSQEVRNLRILVAAFIFF